MQVDAKQLKVNYAEIRHENQLEANLTDEQVQTEAYKILIKTNECIKEVSSAICAG